MTDPATLAELLPPLFLLAGSMYEGRRVATVDLDLPPLSWHCVRDANDPRLLGVSDRWRYRIVGTFWERQDAGEIHARVVGRRLREATADDLAVLAQRSAPDRSVRLRDEYIVGARDMPDSVRDRLINGRWT
ncbi:MAG TPA: hypothetical protein VFQ42_04195 [Mycobacterium sp.]|nr:hypothetical protein [Mycobacterium sp.]